MPMLKSDPMVRFVQIGPWMCLRCSRPVSVLGADTIRSLWEVAQPGDLRFAKISAGAKLPETSATARRVCEVVPMGEPALKATREVDGFDALSQQHLCDGI